MPPGSGNRADSYTLHLEAARLMGLPEPDGWLLPDEERFANQPRNLVMDCSRAAAHGIRFADSLEGIAEALNHPYRTE